MIGGVSFFFIDLIPYFTVPFLEERLRDFVVFIIFVGVFSGLFFLLNWIFNSVMKSEAKAFEISQEYKNDQKMLDSYKEEMIKKIKPYEKEEIIIKD
jgi:hypothetical protein